MEEALEFLVAQLFDAEEAVPLVEAALASEVAFVPLDEAPPSADPAALVIMAPGLDPPLVMRAEFAGEGNAGMYPLRLRTNATDRPRLESFLGERSRAVAERTIGSAAPHMAGAAGASLALAMPVVERPGPSPSGASGVLPRGEHDDERRRETSDVDTLLGRVIGQRYRVDRLLGKGGMGRVYLARHLALEKNIALKVLRSSFTNNPEFAALFQREALAASKLDHRHVMRVLDFGEEPDGLLYIAMELLTGDDLGRVIEREKRLDLRRAVELMSQVCAALSAAHQRGVVHRDMKPENIVIVEREDDEGRVIEHVKVCDFGLAKMQESTSSKESRVGEVKGTPD